MDCRDQRAIGLGLFACSFFARVLGQTQPDIWTYASGLMAGAAFVLMLLPANRVRSDDPRQQKTADLP